MAEPPRTILTVNRKAFYVRLWWHPEDSNKYKITAQYPCSPGMDGLETPSGVYFISSRAKDPAWYKPKSPWVPREEWGEIVPGGAPENPLKSRWLGFWDGAGLHGVSDAEMAVSEGRAASHGCLRMWVTDIEELYDHVALGTPILIS